MLWLAAAPFMPLVSVVRGTSFVLMALALPSVEERKKQKHYMILSVRGYLVPASMYIWGKLQAAI